MFPVYLERPHKKSNCKAEWVSFQTNFIYCRHATYTMFHLKIPTFYYKIIFRVHAGDFKNGVRANSFWKMGLCLENQGARIWPWYTGTISLITAKSFKLHVIPYGDTDLGPHWMACYLMAPSHYLNQWWLITSEILLHSHEDNYTENAQNIYPWYQNYFKITATSLRD